MTLPLTGVRVLDLTDGSVSRVAGTSPTSARR